MTIAELTDQILAFRDARDWAQFHRPKDMAAAVAIEAAELQEHFLWKTHEESAVHLAKRGADVAEEMADVAIYLFIMAADAGIDLLVMGAYTHSRMRQLILGGVTRHVLEEAAIPLFMAH